MGGQIAVTMDNIGYLPQVKAGKIRALAVSTGKRTCAASDLPTVAEAGVPGYESGAWFTARAGWHAKAIVDKRSIETARILKLSDMSKRISERAPN